jgi:Tol biopolymer transport system component
MALRARRRILCAATVALGVAATFGLAAAHAAPRASAAVRWIVFSAQVDGTGIGPAQLFRIDTTGAGIQQVTTGSLPATDPAFAPDGVRIAFVRLGSGLFRVNLDGSGLHRLTSGMRDSYPVWSPDGKHIAFLRPFQAAWRIYVMPASGGKQRLLPLAPAAGRPTWSADSKSLFVPAGAGLAKIDARSGKLQKDFKVTLETTTVQTAAVSPDGRSVTFLGRRDPTGAPDCGESHCPQSALYLAAVSQGRRQRIAPDAGPAGWSPDGKSLVYVLKGSLTIRAVGSGTTTTIDVGTHTAAGDAPPA